MALIDAQVWTATKIDTRLRKLVLAGKDDVAITADHMPTFKKLMDTAGRHDMDELARKFGGFYRCGPGCASPAAAAPARSPPPMPSCGVGVGSLSAPVLQRVTVVDPGVHDHLRSRVDPTWSRQTDHAAIVEAPEPR